MSFETICCLGDSIANGYWCDRGLGWFGRLQEAVATKYPKQYGFNNLAQSGDRTWDAYHRLCSEVMTRRPDILIIAVGCNDLTRWQSSDGPTDQSPQSRDEAWHKILDLCVKNYPKTIVTSLLPSVENRYPCTGWDEKTSMWQRNADTESYNLDIRNWCNERNIPFVDLYTPMTVTPYDHFFEDGSHPNGAGHQFICDLVFKELEHLEWIKTQ